MRKTDEDQRKLDMEMNKLKITLDDFEAEHSKRDSFKWSDVTTGIGRKALLIGIVLVGVNVFSGVFAMSSYTATIFEGTGSNFSPNFSAIFIGLLQFIGASITTQFVDRFGRKVEFCSKYVSRDQVQISLFLYTFSSYL